MSGGKTYYQQKASYNDYCKATFALEGLAKQKSWPLFLAVGPESHFIFRAALKFKTEVKKAGWKTTLLDVDDLMGDVLSESVQSGGFFESVRPCCILRLEKRVGALDELLSLAGADGNFGAPIFVSWNGEKLPVKVQARLDKVKAVIVPCLTPQPAEWGSVVADMAYDVGVKLRPDGVQALLGVVGFDARILENEIRALGLLFQGQGRELSDLDVKANVSMMREDHAFGMDEHLREGRQGRASILVESLLDRGEAPLALLGLLARHVRNGVRGSEALRQRASAQQVATELRIPQGVARSLLAYVGKRGASKFSQAIISAAGADRQLKSSGSNEKIGLNTIVDALS